MTAKPYSDVLGSSGGSTELVFSPNALFSTAVVSSPWQQQLLSDIVEHVIPAPLMYLIRRRKTSPNMFERHGLREVGKGTYGRVMQIEVQRQKLAVKFFTLDTESSDDYFGATGLRVQFAADTRSDLENHRRVTPHDHIVDVLGLLETQFIDDTTGEPLDGGTAYPFAVVMPFIEAVPLSAAHPAFY